MILTVSAAVPCLTITCAVPVATAPSVKAVGAARPNPPQPPRPGTVRAAGFTSYVTAVAARSFPNWSLAWTQKVWLSPVPAGAATGTVTVAPCAKVSGVAGLVCTRSRLANGPANMAGVSAPNPFGTAVSTTPAERDVRNPIDAAGAAGMTCGRVQSTVAAPLASVVTTAVVGTTSAAPAGLGVASVPRLTSNCTVVFACPTPFLSVNVKVIGTVAPATNDAGAGAVNVGKNPWLVTSTHTESTALPDSAYSHVPPAWGPGLIWSWHVAPSTAVKPTANTLGSNRRTIGGPGMMKPKGHSVVPATLIIVKPVATPAANPLSGTAAAISTSMESTAMSIEATKPALVCTTWTTSVSVAPKASATMDVVPTDTAATKADEVGAFGTVTMDGSSVCHSTGGNNSCPVDDVTLALIVTPPPTTSCRVLGLIVNVAPTAFGSCTTVTAMVAVSVPCVAVSVAVPAASAVTKPVPPTRATRGLSDDHTTEAPGMTFPRLSITWALTVSRSPAARLSAVVDRTSDAAVGTSTGVSLHPTARPATIRPANHLRIVPFIVFSSTK